MDNTEKTENEFTNQEFGVKLVREYIFETVKVNGREIKRSLDKKVFYPFDN